MASTESQIDLLSAAVDAPANQLTPESGARLEYVNIKGAYTGLTAGFNADFILYVKNNRYTGTTPIADYLSNSGDAPSQAQQGIRMQKLKYAHVQTSNTSTFPVTFSFKKRFRKPITFNEGTVLKLGIRNQDVSKVLDWQIYATFRK